MSVVPRRSPPSSSASGTIGLASVTGVTNCSATAPRVATTCGRCVVPRTTSVVPVGARTTETSITSPAEVRASSNAAPLARTVQPNGASNTAAVAGAHTMWPSSCRNGPGSRVRRPSTTASDPPGVNWTWWSPATAL